MSRMATINKVARWVLVSLIFILIYGIDLIVGFGAFFTARESTTANALFWGSILLGEPSAFLLLPLRPRAAAILLAGVATFSGVIALFTCLRGSSKPSIFEILWFAFAFWGPKFLLALCFLQSQRSGRRNTPICGQVNPLP